MKKYFLTLIICLLLTISLNYIEYIKYNKVMNIFISNVIDTVVSNYSDVDSEDLIKLINTNNLKKDIIKKYGLFASDLSYIQDMNKKFYQNLTLNIIITFIFITIIFIIIYLAKYKKEKEIINLTNYLKKINNKIYELDILDNEEGDLSILKNEIYKTTVSLKNNLEKEYDDKKVLKDNLASIAHQLKTPLTSITLMIDMILEGYLDKEKEKEFLKDIQKEIENINFLIIAMLKLSRFDANVIEFQKKEVLVEDLINSSLKKLDLLRELKNINVQIKIEKSIVINVDKNWEEEALTNIIKNAYEHSYDNGYVYINCFDNGVYVSIEIVNEGDVIKKSDLHHIFERFYKGNDKTNNFGIGLSLAKEIIEHDGGLIKVKSNNKETRFTICYYK